MVYITKSNLNRILRRVDISDFGEIDGVVYKRPIYYLSKTEEKYLLLMQALLKNPAEFAVEVYQPVINKDTYRLVYESEQSPSFHLTPYCSRLNSKYKNFEIPFEIKVRAFEAGGEKKEREQVINFRNWFKTHSELYINEPEVFLRKLDVDWNVQRKISEIEKDNSGIKEMENYNLNELENEIDKVIFAAGNFFKSNPDKQTILRRFQKMTFLAYSSKEIYDNDTGLSDPELKEFLLNYDKSFKIPLKRLLQEYYRVLYNPQLEFNGELLRQLNFQECFSCRHVEQTVPSVIIEEEDTIENMMSKALEKLSNNNFIIQKEYEFHLLDLPI